MITINLSQLMDTVSLEFRCDSVEEADNLFEAMRQAKLDQNVVELGRPDDPAYTSIRFGRHTTS